MSADKGRPGMALDTDFHSHVSRSSALAMAEAAKARGLRVLGLSEHVFQMHEGRAPLNHLALEGPLQTFSSYIESVQEASQIAGLEVRLGLEVDYIPDKNDEIQRPLHQYSWDYLIGSIHEVDGELFELPHKRTCERGEALWRRYYALLRKAAQSGYFDVISHPVRMRSTNPYLPSDLDTELEHLAAVAKAANVALELNGYDTLTYTNLVRRLARACAYHGTAISVGSDAHDPRRIAQAHSQTQEILRTVGIRKVRIWHQRQPEDYLIN